jgi:hypothetical protein
MTMIAPAATPTRDRKTLRHSALRALGPVQVKITRHPSPSRYNGQLPYVCLQVQGDQTRYCLAVENNHVGAQLASLPLNEWVQLQATGRDEDARLVIAGESKAAPSAVVAPVVAPQRTTAASPCADPFQRAVELVSGFAARFGREPSPAEAVVLATLAIR